MHKEFKMERIYEDGEQTHYSTDYTGEDMTIILEDRFFVEEGDDMPMFITITVDEDADPYNLELR